VIIEDKPQDMDLNFDCTFSIFFLFHRKFQSFVFFTGFYYVHIAETRKTKSTIVYMATL